MKKEKIQPTQTTKKIKPVKKKPKKIKEVSPQPTETKRKPHKAILGILIALALIGVSIYFLIRGDKKGIYGIVAGVFLLLLFARVHPKKTKDKTTPVTSKE